MVARVGIVDALANNTDGLTVSQLVALLGASDSQVRRSLSGLVAAGAVTTLKDEPTGPGRPTLRFRLAPTSNAWPELARMLVAMMARIERNVPTDPLAVARRRGAEMANGEFPHGVVDVMAGLGFSPRDQSSRQDIREQAARVSFQNCPFRDAVLAEGGHLVCTLHRGLLEGMSHALGGVVEAFEVRDPIAAGCEVRLRPS